METQLYLMKIDELYGFINENGQFVIEPMYKTAREFSEGLAFVSTTDNKSFYLKKDFNKASECFYNALNCPNGIGNPFILMRLGQSLYERNELKKAKEYLLRAYMLEGNKIFNQEDEKYFELIKNEI